MRAIELINFVKKHKIDWEFSECNTELSLIVNFHQFAILQHLVGSAFFEDRDFLIVAQYGSILILMSDICKYCGIELEQLNFN